MKEKDKVRQTVVVGPRRQKVVIEAKDPFPHEWWVMFDDGRIEVFDTASAALRAVKTAAGRRNPGVTITSIEWRGVPTDWKPPQI